MPASKIAVHTSKLLFVCPENSCYLGLLDVLKNYFHHFG